MISKVILMDIGKLNETNTIVFALIKAAGEDKVGSKIALVSDLGIEKYISIFRKKSGEKVDIENYIKNATKLIGSDKQGVLTKILVADLGILNKTVSYLVVNIRPDNDKKITASSYVIYKEDFEGFISLLIMAAEGPANLEYYVKENVTITN